MSPPGPADRNAASGPVTVLREGMAYHFECDSQNIFFRCVEDSSEAIMITDKSGLLVYVNPAWVKIYGYTKEEAVGQTPRLLHSGMQAREFYKGMWDAIQDPELGTWKGELINRAKDGTMVPVLLTITPFRDEKGAVSGFMSIAVDVTYKRELEAKVAHQDRLASIGLLASGLAHEVGTPLGVVRGRAEFLMMRAQDELVKKNLEVITSQIDRISKLIRSLLRVSRSFSDVHLETVDVGQVTSEVLALVGQNLKEDGVAIRTDIPEGLIAYADFGRVEQVLLNLVMNSIHAIRKAIAQGRGEGHYLAIQARVEGEAIEIDVVDTGCGIAPENMKKLFQPFFTTKDVGEGTGLGLAIVAQLIREMSGKIYVKSTVNQGSTFTVELPAQK